MLSEVSLETGRAGRLGGLLRHQVISGYSVLILGFWTLSSDLFKCAENLLLKYKMVFCFMEKQNVAQWRTAKEA